LACLPFCPSGLINIQAAGRKGIFAGGCPALRLLFSTGGSALLRGYFVQASVSWFMPSLVCFQHTTARCGTPYRISPFGKNFILAIPHNSKCRYGERGAADAKPKAQIILDVLSSILATQMPCRSCRSGA